MQVILALVLLNVFNVYSSSVDIHFNSAEDPLQANAACGASGYILDAPLPDYTHTRARDRRAATNHDFRVWPQGTIPYVIDDKFSKVGKRLIRKAMNHWSNETCVSFVERKKEDDYLVIIRGNGCCSYVGRRGGKQYLSLGKGCLRFGIITHELGHAVGFWHEQNRPDRSIYIDVIYDNVDSSKYLNFDPRSLTEVNTFDQIYDYESIMHYGTRFFTKNGGYTIQTKTSKDGNFVRSGHGDLKTNEIGKSYYKYDGPVLSKQDIIEANLLYKCTKLTECGGTLFANSGSFTSVNFPNEYPLDQQRDCIWVISRTKHEMHKGFYTSLTLLFDHFYVGNHAKSGFCEDDYVEVREGKGYLSPYLVRYCGNQPPAPISTMTGSLYVRFHISGKNANHAVGKMFTGFMAIFKTDACSHRITEFPAKIQTPQFPFGYQKETDCIWVIQAKRGMRVEIEFQFFSLRELDVQRGCLDYIEIHEGDSSTEKFIGRYCGTNNPGKISSEQNKIKIHFHASKLKQLGWYMGYQAIIKEKDVDECVLDIHKCSQACINYPGGYFCGCYSGYDTIYQQSSNKATCVDKDECSANNGGCSHKCINTDGSFTCSCPEGYTFTADKKTCIDINECAFQNKPCSQLCRNTNGSFECSCYQGYILKSDNQTCRLLPNCIGEYTSPVGLITSPLISPTYKHSINCKWDVTIPVHLQLSLSIDLPWGENKDCHNFLVIHESASSKRHLLGRKVCIQSDVIDDVIMDKNTAVIEYLGQVPFLPRFSIQYHSIAPVDKTCGDIFNSTHGRIHTPGYPYQYPNLQDCEWVIHSPNKKQMKINFRHFHLEYHTKCEYDYVEVEEVYYHILAIKRIGRFCGINKPPILYIDGRFSFLKLKFHSDATMSRKGFKVLFKEKN